MAHNESDGGEKSSKNPKYPRILSPDKKSRRNSADKRQSIEKNNRFSQSSGNTYCEIIWTRLFLLLDSELFRIAR